MFLSLLCANYMRLHSLGGFAHLAFIWQILGTGSLLGILFLILEERVQREKSTLGASLFSVDFCCLVESDTIFFLSLQNFHLIDFNVLTVTTIVLARRLIVAIVKEVKPACSSQNHSFLLGQM